MGSLGAMYSRRFFLKNSKCVQLMSGTVLFWVTRDAEDMAFGCQSLREPEFKESSFLYLSNMVVTRSSSDLCLGIKSCQTQERRIT